nr:hypothetical protein [Nodosilinea sp. LEGE 06152]
MTQHFKRSTGKTLKQIR